MRILLVFFILVVMIVFLNVLMIAIVSDSYDLSMAKAEGLFLRSRCELITETALIASLLPAVPADARRSDDQGEPRGRAPPSDQTSRRRPEPPELHHQRRAAAIVDNRTQKLEAEQAANKTGAGRDEGHAPAPRRQGEDVRLCLGATNLRRLAN